MSRHWGNAFIRIVVLNIEETFVAARKGGVMGEQSSNSRVPWYILLDKAVIQEMLPQRERKWESLFCENEYSTEMNELQLLRALSLLVTGKWQPKKKKTCFFLVSLSVDLLSTLYLILAKNVELEKVRGHTRPMRTMNDFFVCDT